MTEQQKAEQELLDFMCLLWPEQRPSQPLVTALAAWEIETERRRREASRSEA